MATPRRLVLDSGAVIALARDDVRARAHLIAAWEEGIEVWVPAVVLAETIRGRRPDAPVNRVVKAVGNVVGVTGDDGRAAGRLLGETDLKATVDALVVASTQRLGGGVILTADPDMSRLSEGIAEVSVVDL